MPLTVSCRRKACWDWSWVFLFLISKVREGYSWLFPFSQDRPWYRRVSLDGSPLVLRKEWPGCISKVTFSLLSLEAEEEPPPPCRPPPRFHSENQARLLKVKLRKSVGVSPEADLLGHLSLRIDRAGSLAISKYISMFLEAALAHMTLWFSVFICLSSGKASNFPCDLKFLMGLRTVVDFQCVQFFPCEETRNIFSVLYVSDWNWKLHHLLNTNYSNHLWSIDNDGDELINLGLDCTWIYTATLIV